LRATPPAELVALLSRLGLATPRQVRAAYRHTRRLAKDLALFDSVWVDALVQARILTPFQAAAINEGRGENLRVGSFTLVRPQTNTASGSCYEAHEIANGRAMRLTVMRVRSGASEALEQVERLIEKSMAVRSPHLVPIEKCGLDNGQLWTASASVAGRTAAAWLVRGGRMPGEVVLEIARQMVATLTICETAGLWHGDISAQQMVLNPLGQVQLLDPGLRILSDTLLTGELTDRGVETADYLAPERAAASPVTVATEIFACGALWWHLLAGRPPFAGANHVDRLRATCTTRIRDIKPIAPDTPEPLIAAIRCATEPAPERRPKSFAELLQLLGPPSDRGQALLARFVARGVSPPERLVRRVRTIRRSPNLPTWATASAGVLLALGIGTWPLWTSDSPAAQPLAVQQAAGVATLKLAPKPVASNVAIAVRRDAASQVVAATAPARGKPQEPLAEQKKSQVVRTSATQPVAVGPRQADEKKAVSREFVISAHRPVPWSQVRPAQGQCVRSRPGERAQIILPASGAILATENVRFEDVDFVVSAPTTQSVLTITAAGATFTRCSLQVTAEAGQPPAAFDWQPVAIADATSSARLELRECVLANVGAGVRCGAKRPAEIAMTDVLFLGADALAEIDSSHDVPGRVDVLLRHCTVRGAAEVLAWRAPAMPASALNVEAVDCVFELAATGAVLAVSSREGAALSPDILRMVVWRGSGSLIGLKTPLLRWRREDGTLQPISDARLRAEGLVRTEMGFAGDIGEGPDASRLVRWRVPLRSATPPGIGDMALPRLR
jgi:eukaryotic-like serine/threonine-protein kinase